MRILIAEDDPELGRQIEAALREAGYAPELCPDGEIADYLGRSESYDAVILDLGLPTMDGLRVLKGWREAGATTPVLILTARDRWRDKVEGIDAGADDYLTKPFHMEELLARLRALLRRAAGHASAELAFRDVRLDTRTARVTRAGEPVRLTSHEYRVLAYLMHHQGRIVSRTELTEHIYAQDFDRDSNTIEVFVGRLRRKLGSEIIETVRGLGYTIGPHGKDEDPPGPPH